jgi:lipid A 3-O-deacylase
MQAAIAFALAAGAGVAEPLAARQSSIGFRFDDDVTVGSDRGYTAAFAFVWEADWARATSLEPWIERVLDAPRPGEQRTVGFTFGQKLYTPENIDAREVIPDDRPYAGILHASAGVTRRIGDHERSYSLMLGWVGPAALGAEMHRFAHHLIGSPDPRGWGNQLGNEPIVQYDQQYRWKAWRDGSADGLGVEFVPHVAGGAGNLSIYGSVGGEVRLGWRLGETFGSSLIRPAGFRGNVGARRRRGQANLFVAFDQKLVLRNLVLDGNTFGGSHSVDREPLTSDIVVGARVGTGPLLFEFEHIFWTRRFAQEPYRQSWSALSIRYQPG